MKITVPVKLLHEARGHTVSIELTNGISYRGKLSDVEDNMNLQLKDVVIIGKDGATKNAAQVYIRGSQIQFISIPDILQHAPVLEQNNKQTEQ